MAAMCAACTHLETRPTGEVAAVQPGAASSSGAQRGLSYALPMVQYELKITRTLESCPTDENPLAKFAVKVEATERYVAGERFEINYQALSSIMKVTNFDVEFHESGTLKTINASAEDQTGPVLGNLARIGVAVASVATGNPAGATVLFSAPGASAAPARTLVCTAAAEAAVRERAAATADIRALAAEIERWTSEVTRLSEYAALEVMNDDDKAALRLAVRTLLDKEQALRAANRRLAAAVETLSATEELRWPTLLGTSNSHRETLRADAASLRKLRSLFVVGSQTATAADSQRSDSCGPSGSLDVCLGDLTALNLALVPITGPQIGSGIITSEVIATSDRRWAQGIYVREPEEARLVICRVPVMPDITGCPTPDTLVLRDDIVVAPQLGRLRLLPFTNGPFEDNELELSMRANGLIEHFSYGEESSAASATAAAADIAERIDAGLERMETERRSDEQYGRDTRTYERSEAAANRAEEVAQINHQIALLTAQSQRLTAQMALDTANPAAAAEQARIDAEIKMLQSRIARIRAAAELAALEGS